MRIGKSECCGKGKFKIPQAANERDKLKLPADMLINNLRLIYFGVFTLTKTLAFWPQFLCLSSWMYMTAKASKSMHLGA